MTAPHRILGSAPCLQNAVDTIFSTADCFDQFAEAQGIKYYITAAVDVKPDSEGRVRTADLKPFGLDYTDTYVTVEQLRKDRIFPYALKSSAVWMDSTNAVIVRLERGQTSHGQLVAQIVYGLYKGMYRESFEQAEKFFQLNRAWGAAGKESLKQEFLEDVEGCLERLRISARPKYDQDPASAPADILVRLFVAARKDPETYGTLLNQALDWGGKNPSYPGMGKATAFAEKLMAHYHVN